MNKKLFRTIIALMLACICLCGCVAASPSMEISNTPTATNTPTPTIVPTPTPPEVDLSEYVDFKCYIYEKQYHTFEDGETIEIDIKLDRWTRVSKKIVDEWGRKLYYVDLRTEKDYTIEDAYEELGIDKYRYFAGPTRHCFETGVDTNEFYIKYINGNDPRYVYLTGEEAMAVSEKLSSKYYDIPRNVIVCDFMISTGMRFYFDEEAQAYEDGTFTSE